MPVRTHTLLRRTAGIAMCLSVLVCTAAAAPEPASGHSFTHYTSANSGLPYDMVNEIVQDSKGFVWFGTSSGLSRFDGTRFRNYSRKELGLKSAYVIALCPDGEGNLWVGTDLGVTVYNARMDRFEPFVRESDVGTVIHNKANVICRGPDGVIWMSVNNQGLFAYDPATDTLHNYFYENGRQTLPVNIRTMHVDADNGLWIALFYRSLFHVAPGGTVPADLMKSRSLEFFRNDDVTAIQSSPGNSAVVYIASATKGLCRLDRGDGSVEVLIPLPSLGCSPEDLFIDRNGRVWMSTNEGVYIYDPDTNSTHLLTADGRDRFSLSDSHAFAVYVDASDGLWIGTNVGGVNYSGAFQQNFEKQYLAGGQSLGDCLVRGFTDDRAGRIWVTTEKEGLLVYDTAKRSLEKVVNDRLPNTQFTACHDAGTLWLGTLKGLYSLDIGTGNVRAYETLGLPASMQDRRVFAVFRTTTGELLVGTTVGLFRHDRRNDTFDPVEGFEGVFVTGMDEDTDGVLWVSTYARGLVRYDLRQRKVTGHYTDVANGQHTDPIPSNKLFSVFAGSEGRVWMTSFSGGFCCLDKASGHVKTYDTSHYDGLQTDIYFKIIEDDAGTLWVSSDKGLLSLNPLTDEIRLFSVYDGLLNDDFKNCGLKTADGDLYFGSRSGFIRFNPKRFILEDGDPRLTITDFRVGDELVTPSSDGSSPLASNVDEIGEIRLSPRQNSFGFGFAVLNSSSPGLNTIVCRLEGYEQEWRHAAADNTTFYYNVPAGTYTLKIKSLNSSGAVHAQHADLTIVVAQRFYKSTAAVMLYTLLLTGLIAGIFVVYYRRAIAREKRKHEEYKQQKEVELFHQKISFFSSIVHEIKTPLTVIRAPLQNIMASERLSPAERDDLKVIGNSTEYLDRLVRELLDFVRIERHGYELNPRPLDITERVGFLCSNFAETAKARNLRLTFTPEAEGVRIDADEAAMNKILNNVLHNAVKYAETYIEVTVAKRDGKAVVSIGNDGPLITAEQRTEIFKPFVRYSNDKEPYPQSFGIGLALARTLTEMHAGTLRLDDDPGHTVFVLTLPALETETEPAAEPAQMPVAEDASRPLILLVEDNRELSSYIKHKLDAEYRVLTAHSAEKARTLLREHEADIIVTDIALPGMNGIELCRTVASDFNLSHTPVIVVSAISDTGTKIACIEAGASTYIEKPFNLEYLQACIKGILEKRASLKKAYQSLSGQVDPKQFNLSGADEEFLRRIDEVIMQNLRDPSFSSRQIEEALFLSRSTLIRKVRALLDTTPNDYLRFKRLSVAAQLLSQNKCRISEVCFAVGFNSPSYFAKCFKEQFGILPAEYQRK